MKITNPILFVLAGCLLSACSQAPGDSINGSISSPTASGPSIATVEHVNAAQAAAWLAESNAVILDIRTPAEFAGGHLVNARNIDFHAPDFEARIAQLDRDTPYLVHCASGGRSKSSLPLFKKLGFTRIHHLDGGYRSWAGAGLATEKD